MKNHLLKSHINFSDSWKSVYFSFTFDYFLKFVVVFDSLQTSCIIRKVKFNIKRHLYMKIIEKEKENGIIKYGIEGTNLEFDTYLQAEGYLKSRTPINEIIKKISPNQALNRNR